MNELYRALTACLLCQSTALQLVVPLEPIPIATPNFALGLAGEQLAEALTGVPLDLYQCETCGHVQVGQVGNPDLQYRDYVYTTALSRGLAEHFRGYAERVLERLVPPLGSLVVEIGSNDGTLLHRLKEGGMRVLGVDPARRIAAEATARGIPTLPEFFSRSIASKILHEHGKAQIVIANNVIANLHDLVDFAQAIGELLDDEGTFLFETQYGADVIERTLLDTIYHEHLSYFFVRPTAAHFARFGLEVISVERVATKGGSIRVGVRRRGAGPADGSVAAAIANEELCQMFEPSYCEKLVRDVAAIRSEVTAIVASERAAGRVVAGYGVSVGTTTLLAQFALMRDIDFLVDDDPNKSEALEGPGYHIPVSSPERLLEEAPGVTILFAWRYADAIASRNLAYLEKGGRMIVPLPQIRTIERRSSGAAVLHGPSVVRAARKTLRVGIVGGGYIGQLAHIANLCEYERCCVVALAELRPELGQRVAERYGIARTYSSHHELLAADDVDAVVVVTTRSATGPIVLDALSSGRHVLSEKPMAHTLEQGERLVLAAHKQDLRYAVGFMKRHDLGVLRARDLLREYRDQRKLGGLEFVRAYSLHGDIELDAACTVMSEEPRPGGLELWPTAPAWLDADESEEYAIFLNVHGHTINLLRFLFGETPKVEASRTKGGAARVLRFNLGEVSGVLEMRDAAGGPLDRRHRCLLRARQHSPYATPALRSRSMRRASRTRTRRRSPPRTRGIRLGIPASSTSLGRRFS